MNKIFVYILSGAVLFSCGGNESSDSSVDSNGSIIGNTNPVDASADNGSNTSMDNTGNTSGQEVTSIEYFDEKHDFGNVFYPSDNKYTFKFKNTGNVPLVIEDAKASCGCTVPNKPEEPIPPGGIGELDVIFRPKSGQVGQTVSKKITVTANTNPAQTFLEISAKVLDAM